MTPDSWETIPIAPVPKPGKDATCFESYRPIYLLPAIMKLLDKLVHKRVAPKIAEAMSPWQGGGILGADHMAWILDTILRTRATHKKGKTWLAFLDAESAFCRPPHEAVLNGITGAGVAGSDWLAIRAILSGLHACVKIGGKTYGKWKVKCGVPQGGSLSQPLFEAAVLELEAELRKQGCSITIDGIKI